MKKNIELIVPHGEVGTMIGEGAIAKACVYLLNIAAVSNNIKLDDSDIRDSLAVDAKTIEKYRNDIQKDTNG